MRILLISAHSVVALTVFSTLTLLTTGGSIKKATKNISRPIVTNTPYLTWTPWSSCTHRRFSAYYRTRKCRDKKNGSIVQSRLCGRRSEMFCWTEDGITSGSPSEPGRWPWQVLIMTEYNGKWRQCGGTLITPSWVLTAAHCFLDRVGNNWNIQRITLGTINRIRIDNRGVSFTRASIVHVHEDFDKMEYLNDISLMKLPTPVNTGWRHHIEPIFLPKSNKTMLAGKSCVVTGWGATAKNGSIESIPDVLQEVDVNIFTDEACKKMHHTPGLDGSYTESHFCAGHLEGKKDTCYGDSGGPLMCEKNGEYIVHGITSSGPAECGKKNKPGIYTRVSDFITWIGRTIRGLRFECSKWKRNKCSVTCGRGQRTVTRTCLGKDDGPPTKREGISIRYIPCENSPCVEYHWTPWKTTCRLTCYVNVTCEFFETITRYCAGANDAPTFPNNCPGPEHHGESRWVPSSPICSTVCGEVTETSTQNCEDVYNNPLEPENSTGEEKEIKKCVKPDCIEYHWSPWKTTCSVTCNEGVATSTRYCADANNAPTFPKNCPGQEKKYEPCVMPKCIEYNWTPWVSTCNVTCGEGTETTTRKCVDDNNNPSKPENCVGESRKTRKCIKPDCIEYDWTPWVSTCSVTCGEGTETSTRKCVDDKGDPSKPDDCPGEDKKIGKCVKPDCIEYHWGEWFNVSECSASCGTGEIEMKRKLVDSDNVEVLDTSKCNPGKYVKLRTCNLKPCPVYKWSEWKTSCSVTCGTGVLTKSRNCTDQDGNPAEDVLSCGHGKSTEKDVCTSPCPLISKESSTSYHWGKWGSWSTCRFRMGGVTICNGFKSSTRDCLMGSKDVNPRRCSGEYPGEDFYRESSCMMETSNCP
uniref:A disintegrin and metalloproteinase with thrombospondin motifs gon-1-like isoform X2 n=1 Tax=Styela clava TaxID=7725 RepID=UPI0019394931|nr:A disintegrin and metalloproteinase with thrombospondin motifs gon-1-like isoform X2 [Styela clava]